MKGNGDRICKEHIRRCDYNELCDLHIARRWLTKDDWYVIRFFRRVADQFRNQSPGGDSPAITVDLAAWRVALEVYGYPRSHWVWLLDATLMLFRLVIGKDTVRWEEDFGKDVRLIDPKEFY